MTKLTRQSTSAHGLNDLPASLVVNDIAPWLDTYSPFPFFSFKSKNYELYNLLRKMDSKMNPVDWEKFYKRIFFKLCIATEVTEYEQLKLFLEQAKKTVDYATPKHHLLLIDILLAGVQLRLGQTNENTIQKLHALTFVTGYKAVAMLALRPLLPQNYLETFIGWYCEHSAEAWAGDILPLNTLLGPFYTKSHISLLINQLELGNFTENTVYILKTLAPKNFGLVTKTHLSSIISLLQANVNATSASSGDIAELVEVFALNRADLFEEEHLKILLNLFSHLKTNTVEEVNSAYSGSLTSTIKTLIPPFKDFFSHALCTGHVYQLLQMDSLCDTSRCSDMLMILADYFPCLFDIIFPVLMPDTDIRIPERTFAIIEALDKANFLDIGHIHQLTKLAQHPDLTVRKDILLILNNLAHKRTYLKQFLQEYYARLNLCRKLLNLDNFNDWEMLEYQTKAQLETLSNELLTTALILIDSNNKTKKARGYKALEIIRNQDPTLLAGRLMEMRPNKAELEEWILKHCNHFKPNSLKTLVKISAVHAILVKVDDEQSYSQTCILAFNLLQQHLTLMKEALDAEFVSLLLTKTLHFNLSHSQHLMIVIANALPKHFVQQHIQVLLQNLSDENLNIRLNACWILNTLIVKGHTNLFKELNIQYINNIFDILCREARWPEVPIPLIILLNKAAQFFTFSHVQNVVLMIQAPDENINDKGWKLLAVMAETLPHLFGENEVNTICETACYLQFSYKVKTLFELNKHPLWAQNVEINRFLMRPYVLNQQPELVAQHIWGNQGSFNGLNILNRDNSPSLNYETLIENYQKHQASNPISDSLSY